MKSMELYILLKENKPSMSSTEKGFNICDIEFVQTNCKGNVRLFEGEKFGRHYFVIYDNGKLEMVQSGVPVA